MTAPNEEKRNKLTPYIIFAEKYGSYVFGGLSIIVIFGWIFNIEIFKSILPGFSPMNPLEAICFIFASAILLLRIEQKEIGIKRRIIINFLSFFIILAGITTFATIFFNSSWRPDRIFMPEKLNISLISPNSAFNFILLGIALSVGKKNITETFKLTQLLTLIAGIVTMFAGIGYAYHVLSFYKIYIFSPMPFNSVCAFTLLCTCLLLSTHDFGMMTILTDTLSVSRLARRLILIAVILPITLGSILTIVQRFFDPQISTAILVLSQILILTIIIWITTKILYKDELENRTL